ncbi:MAG: hypothetical protein K0R24_1720 [Gammaproteobacteria bacterium]|jgi:hypothetical protein|nr:hypothetical protein [Gammaproteobacteria bacterium]
MAGEWSKMVGERGEVIVSQFLKLVGYNPEEGIVLNCVYPKKHELKKDSPRTTHGIDFLATYKCMLQKDTLEMLVVSSKFTANGYKSDPKGDFKNYFTDLAHTLECFKKSSKRNECIASFNGKGIGTCKETGVLFFLSNKQEDIYTDIVSKISDSTFTDLEFEKVFVIDNNRLSFIFEAMAYAKTISSNIDFVYHDSGLVVNPSDTLNTGKTLPVQYFNSPVLPLRIEKTNQEVVLFIALNDNFNEINLKRLIGLAQKLNTLTNKTILAFPDFNKLSHEQIANKVLGTFNDNSFSSKISIESYKTNFTNQL